MSARTVEAMSLEEKREVVRRVAIDAIDQAIRGRSSMPILLADVSILLEAAADGLVDPPTLRSVPS